MDVAAMELANLSSSNLDEMVEVPVFDPWRNPVNDDSCTADEDDEMTVLVAVSWAVRWSIADAKLVFPPIAWLADA